MAKPRAQKPKFGIGEWFGVPLTSMGSTDRRRIAAELQRKKAEQPEYPCPFKSWRAPAVCRKAGGVCSIRLYEHRAESGAPYGDAVPFDGSRGQVRALCPSRFLEDGEIFRWVGEVILGDSGAQIISEVGFQEAPETVDSPAGKDVGRIDMVLTTDVGQAPGKIDWCALEIQAVYFSGKGMGNEFPRLEDHPFETLPFPVINRRPDYRSSGPKRLMPQLQIKVPSLRRWGKKMAVVVDRNFFDSLGDMGEVSDISNADIAWFVVGFEEDPATGRLIFVRDRVKFTTLERSVEGLTGGVPVSKSEFESRILAKAAAGLNSLDLESSGESGE